MLSNFLRVFKIVPCLFLIFLVAGCSGGGSSFSVPALAPALNELVLSRVSGNFNGQKQNMTNGSGKFGRFPRDGVEIIQINYVFRSPQPLRGFEINIGQINKIVAGTEFPATSNGEAESVLLFIEDDNSGNPKAWQSISGSVFVDEITTDWITIRLQNMRFSPAPGTGARGTCVLNGVLKVPSSEINPD
jgi:hypothetical protein